MSAITGAFTSPFQVAGELGEGTSSILGGNAGTTTNAASISGAGEAAASGPFAAIAASLSADQSPTIAALRTGKLTTSQHNILAAIAAKNNKPTSIPYTNTGTEPSTVAQIRGYGWIKIIKPTYDPTTRLVTSATYELTTVGEAIAKRTGGSTSAAGTSVVA